MLVKYKNYYFDELIESIKCDRELQKELGIDLDSDNKSIINFVDKFNKKFDTNNSDVNKILAGTEFYILLSRSRRERSNG